MPTKNSDVMRFTYFSHHATKRVQQRTRLANQDLALFLDRGLAVNTGCEPGLPREHLLFYSEPDESCFVAVRDTMTGKVVTVLPLDYHQNLAWSITPEQAAKAKELVRGSRPATGCKPAGSIAPAERSVLVVTCTYVESSGKTSIKVLLKLQASQYCGDIGTFMHDTGTPDLLEKAAISKGLNSSQIHTLSVRLGNKGIPETWVLNELNWMH